MYDIVQNPIPRCGLWKTFTLEQISDMVERMPAGQKAEAYNIMMFTLNACNKLVEDEILSKEVFGQ